MSLQNSKTNYSFCNGYSVQREKSKANFGHWGHSLKRLRMAKGAVAAGRAQGAILGLAIFLLSFLSLQPPLTFESLWCVWEFKTTVFDRYSQCFEMVTAVFDVVLCCWWCANQTYNKHQHWHFVLLWMIWIFGHLGEFALRTCRSCADLSFPFSSMLHGSWDSRFFADDEHPFPHWVTQPKHGILSSRPEICFSNFALCTFNCAPNIKRQNSYQLADCCPAYPTVYFGSKYSTVTSRHQLMSHGIFLFILTKSLVTSFCIPKDVGGWAFALPSVHGFPFAFHLLSGRCGKWRKPWLSHAGKTDCPSAHLTFDIEKVFITHKKYIESLSL